MLVCLCHVPFSWYYGKKLGYLNVQNFVDHKYARDINRFELQNNLTRNVFNFPNFHFLFFFHFSSFPSVLFSGQYSVPQPKSSCKNLTSSQDSNKSSCLMWRPSVALWMTFRQYGHWAWLPGMEPATQERKLTQWQRKELVNRVKCWVFLAAFSVIFQSGHVSGNSRGIHFPSVQSA